jgi:hypothetical protein
VDFFETGLALSLKLVEIFERNKQFDILFKVIHSVNFSTLINLVLKLLSPAVVTLFIDSDADFDETIIDSVEFILGILHYLPERVYSSVDFVPRTIELVAAERLPPDQIHLLKCLLFHLLHHPI